VIDLAWAPYSKPFPFPKFLQTAIFKEKTTVTDLDKRVLCATKNVTLDGRPARIIGIRSPHATVAALPDGPAYSYSWQTVQRVVSLHAGAFKS
jgi:hypothetical protein